MEAKQRAAVLGDVDLFRALDGPTLLDLAERAGDRHYASGERLYEQGVTAAELFVVATGAVELSVTRDGRENVVATRRALEPFGEAALYDDGPRMVSARAVDETDVVVVPKQDFQHLVRSEPDVADALLRLMAAVIRESTRG